MEDDDAQISSTVGMSVDDTPAAELTGAHARGVIGVVGVAVIVTLLVRRVGRSNLAGDLRRWLPLLYSSVWGIAVLNITLIYARGLSSSWFLAIWLLFVFVGLASVGWLRSVMSGVAITLEGRIKLGDSVRVNDISGEVIEFGVRALRLRAVDGSIHEIPNEKLVTESVTNLSGDGGDSAAELLISIPAGIEPDRALEIARRVAILTPLASPRHRPEVFLESSGIDGRFELRIRGYAFDAAYQDHFKSDVVSRIQSDFAHYAATEKHHPQTTDR